MDFLPEPAISSALPRTYGGNAAFHNFYNDYSHIQDPNLRRRLALSEIDKVPFGWYHIRAVVVAGIGFFTDSYDIFAINLITSILGMVYWQDSVNKGVLPTNVNNAIKAATSGGAVVGQIVFGWLADLLGRRRMYGIELAIIVFATLAQALTAPSQSVTLTGLLCFWRIVMGIGIGGDYPLSAVITSEFAPTRWRGAMMAAVFSMQGLGQLAAALVALLTTTAFKESFINTTGYSSCHGECIIAGDRAWRIIIGFGAVPACFALYYRITIPETPRYTFDIAHDLEKAQADIQAYMLNQKQGQVDSLKQAQVQQRLGQHLATPPASWSDVFAYFRQWKNLKIIFGTMTSWFFLDLAFYGLGLNSNIVLNAIGYGSGHSIYDTLLHAAIGQLVLISAGSIPGYWLSVVTIDTIGRKPIQIGGFLVLTLLFAIIGFAYSSLSEGSLLGLYILAQFFFNFGPNTTTFIIPGECFPTRYRSTGHGLSAASGKIGAIITQVIAQPLSAHRASSECNGSACTPWLNHLMQIYALFMLCGTIVSFLVPETKGRTLEELAGEGAIEGSHGSIELDDGWRGWWHQHNPFRGGAPAGFRYVKSPNLGPRSPGLRGKRERVGIMTSPELLAKRPRDLNGHGRGLSGGSTAGGYSVSVVSEGRRTEENGDLYLKMEGSGALPGWGRGWGVQRGRNGEGPDDIMLMDVGKLLK